MDRICNEALLRKVTTPRAAAAHIKNGMTVGFSGFTVIGYPKVLPAELARRAEEGEELGITVITGGNVGDQLDGVLARSGVMKRRYGFQGNRDLRALANADRIQYVDTHVSHGPYLIKNGYLGKIDVAVIEVAAIRADGSLVLPFSVGIDDTLVKYADKLILEVNEAIPLEVEGMHDILTLERAPHTQAIEIFKPDDRVGSPYLPCDPDKVAAVILTNCEDTNQDSPAPTPDMEAIASHIVKFLQSEVAAGRLPNPLPPMQSGVGGVANAVLSALARSELDHLSVYTEVMQDAVVELIDAGKVACASGTALTISPSARERFYAHIDDYKGKYHPPAPGAQQRPRGDPPPEHHRHEHRHRGGSGGQRQLHPHRRGGRHERHRRLRRLRPQLGYRHFLHRLHRQGRRHLLYCAPRGPRGSHGARHRDHRHRAGPGGSAGPDGLRAGPCPD